MKLLRRLFGRPEMTCEQVGAVLQHYLDHELDSSEVPKVLAHLEKCRDCGLEAEAYQSIKDGLRSYQRAPEPASLEKLRDMARQISEFGPEAFETS